MDMPTSDQLVKEIKSAQQRLKVAEKDLRAPRAPIILGPMDVVTPWTEDANRVKLENDKIEELTKELGAQVLRERG